MKKCALSFLMGLLIMGFAGCKAGIQVQDNTYDALGGQVIKVSDDFQYVGQCDPAFLSADAQGGRHKTNNGVKTRGDVFVRTTDGQPLEIFVIQRAMLTKTGWYWSKTNGEPVDFHGRGYKESFFDATKSDNPTVISYVNFLKKNGYSIDKPNVVVREMSKLIGRQTMAHMFYGIYPGLIPESMRGDAGQAKQYIRERFDESVTVLQ